MWSQASLPCHDEKMPYAHSISFCSLDNFCVCVCNVLSLMSSPLPLPPSHPKYSLPQVHFLDPCLFALFFFWGGCWMSLPRTVCMTLGLLHFIEAQWVHLWRHIKHYVWPFSALFISHGSVAGLCHGILPCLRSTSHAHMAACNYLISLLIPQIFS